MLRLAKHCSCRLFQRKLYVIPFVEPSITVILSVYAESCSRKYANLVYHGEYGKNFVEKDVIHHDAQYSLFKVVIKYLILILPNYVVIIIRLFFFFLKIVLL